MSAPKENKYAKGHGKGRPKKYTSKKIEEIAESLKEWVKDEKTLFLRQFCVKNGINRRLFSKWSREDEVFRDTIENIKDQLITRIIEKTVDKKMSLGIANLLIFKEIQSVYKGDNEEDRDKKKPSPNAWRDALEDMEPVDLDELE